MLTIHYYRIVQSTRQDKNNILIIHIYSVLSLLKSTLIIGHFSLYASKSRKVNVAKTSHEQYVDIHSTFLLDIDLCDESRQTLNGLKKTNYRDYWTL